MEKGNQHTFRFESGVAVCSAHLQKFKNFDTRKSSLSCDQEKGKDLTKVRIQVDLINAAAYKNDVCCN